ncbi:unnamed protein product [Amaranthus hypochondriacus]
MGMKVWDCGSPLYDSYELASVSHLIERHLMILPSINGSKRFRMHQSKYVHDHHATTSTAVIASMNQSDESKGEYMVVSRLSGCMGSYSLWRIMKGNKIMKIKFKKFKLSGIKWFM